VRKFLLMLLAFVLAIFLLAACGKNDNNEGAGNNGSEFDMPEPDLDSIPDIVAEVNGEEITKEDFTGLYEQQFQQQALQAQMSGAEIDEDTIKTQTAEGLIGQFLLTKEAEDKISEVSEAEVDEVLNNFLTQYGMESKEELFEQLSEQGVDENDFMSDIEKQAKIERLIADEVGEIDVPEDEIKEAYDEVKAQQEAMEDSDQEFPDYDEAKPILEEQLKNEKQAMAIQEIVDKLRDKADVTLYI